MTTEEREKGIRGLCKLAKVSVQLADHYVASDLTIEEIQRELTSLTARADEKAGEIIPSKAFIDRCRAWAERWRGRRPDDERES